MSEIKETTDSSFQSDILESDQPALVDFWAPWCGPCQMIAPVLQEVAKNFNEKIMFFKLNTDENQTTPQKYGVMAIPSILIFKNGEEVERIVGFEPKERIEARLNRIINTEREN